MALDNLRDLFLRGMQAAYDWERQQIEAYPASMETLEEPAAREGLQAHIDETKRQAERLERIFAQMGEEPIRGENPVAQGLLGVGQGILEESGDRGVIDAGYIAALQLGEHYEIASYGTLRTHAEALGMAEAADLLQQTLDEEAAEDVRLSELAVKVANPRAQQ